MRILEQWSHSKCITRCSECV